MAAAPGGMGGTPSADGGSGGTKTGGGDGHFVDAAVAVDGAMGGAGGAPTDSSALDGGAPDGADEPVTCAADLRDGTTMCLPSDPTCVKGCGPDRIGRKSCTCDTAKSVYSCGHCSFAPGHDYSCYQLPATVPACPTATHSNTPCAAPPCTPCGGYIDGSGATKVGYCVCSKGAWTCGSTIEWPPQ